MNAKNFTAWCNSLAAALKADLPGAAAQQRMAPVPRRNRPAGPEEPVREGAVLLLLCHSDEGLWIPLTLRSDRVVHHKNQISLPGGVREPADHSLAQTAVREAQEEIGVNPDFVHVLGALSPLFVPSGNYDVHPYVACYRTAPAFRLNPTEVVRILQMPLSALCDERNCDEEERMIEDRVVRVPYYRLEEHKIWGATAMIFSEFAAVLAKLSVPGKDTG